MKPSMKTIKRPPGENTSVICDSSVLQVTNHLPGGSMVKSENAYLYIESLNAGEEVARFRAGHSFVSAFVT